MRGTKYYKRLIVGSVLFEMIVFGNEVYNNGLWNLSGLLWVAYGAIGIGVLLSLIHIYLPTNGKNLLPKGTAGQSF